MISHDQPCVPGGDAAHGHVVRNLSSERNGARTTRMGESPWIASEWFRNIILEHEEKLRHIKTLRLYRHTSARKIAKACLLLIRRTSLACHIMSFASSPKHSKNHLKAVKVCWKKHALKSCWKAMVAVQQLVVPRSSKPPIGFRQIRPLQGVVTLGTAATGGQIPQDRFMEVLATDQTVKKKHIRLNTIIITLTSMYYNVCIHVISCIHKESSLRISHVRWLCSSWRYVICVRFTWLNVASFGLRGVSVRAPWVLRFARGATSPSFSALLLHQPLATPVTSPAAVKSARPNGCLTGLEISQSSNRMIRLCLFIWLVVGPPLWKIWKSIGMMTFPIYGKIKNVPNHQPVMFIFAFRLCDFWSFHLPEPLRSLLHCNPRISVLP